LLAGLGIADLPEFIIGDAIASGAVEIILKGWKQPEGALHWVTPPGGPRPARVEVLAEFLMKHFAKGKKRGGEAMMNNLVPAAQMRPSDAISLSPQETEGAGNAGCSPHPQPRLQIKKANERSHHRFAEITPAFPARWSFQLLRALPGVSGLLATV